jgi:hypothetical protein
MGPQPHHQLDDQQQRINNTAQALRRAAPSAADAIQLVALNLPACLFKNKSLHRQVFSEFVSWRQHNYN